MIKRGLLHAILLVSPCFVQAGAFDELKAAAPRDASLSVPEAAPAAQAAAAQGAPARAPSLPSEFTIHERVISLTDTFDLKDGKKTMGTITEKFFSMTKSFKYVDAAGVCVAEARARFFSWGTHVDVTDCQGRKVGAIKENVLKSFFKVYTTYSILDGSDKEIATSEKVEWISTDVALTSRQGRAIAALHRPWLNFLSDNWTVKVSDPNACDSRLIVMIAAYKTSVDNDRRREESGKSDDK